MLLMVEASLLLMFLGKEVKPLIWSRSSKLRVIAALNPLPKLTVVAKQTNSSTKQDAEINPLFLVCPIIFLPKSRGADLKNEFPHQLVLAKNENGKRILTIVGLIFKICSG